MTFAHQSDLRVPLPPAPRYQSATRRILHDDGAAKHLEYAFPSHKATEFYIISVNLACDPSVTGLGIPFHSEETIDGEINKDEPIYGQQGQQAALKLTQLLQQRIDG